MSELSKKTKADLNEENSLLGRALEKMHMMAAMQQVIFTVVLSLIPDEHNPIYYEGFKKDVLSIVLSEEVKNKFLESESKENLQVYKAIVERILDDVIESYNNYRTAEINEKDN